MRHPRAVGIELEMEDSPEAIKQVQFKTLQDVIDQVRYEPGSAAIRFVFNVDGSASYYGQYFHLEKNIEMNYCVVSRGKYTRHPVGGTIIRKSISELTPEDLFGAIFQFYIKEIMNE